MRLGYTVPVLVALAGGSVSAAVSAAAAEPLVCRIDALSASQRSRQQVLAEKLARAIVGKTELPNGLLFALDLSRLPADAAGAPFCVVEVAEWVDLEARCCPFLDFGIELPGKGSLVRLRLTGGRGVKEFLENELPMAHRAAR
ncbi:MAG TPA: hypothetical protein VMR54_05615 [Thermoanaerobaculia bacterium]|nr:hypothetical protein [Thermoanaerobaculia bacterium]